MSKSEAQPKSLTFTLKNINPVETIQRFNIHSIHTNKPIQSTLIEDITKTQNEQLLFLVKDKKRNVHVSMVNMENKQKLKQTLCFWCRHPFSDEPIGCPIRYHTHKMLQFCDSKITNEHYTVCQKISKFQKYNENKNNVFIPYNEYETDGIFCSFNCCKAFILDNRHNPLYRMSEFLLVKLHMDLFELKEPFTILPAPSWRMLVQYGGDMTIDQFRDTFQKYTYEQQYSIIHTLPKCRPVGYIYDENYMF